MRQHYPTRKKINLLGNKLKFKRKDMQEKQNFKQINLKKDNKFLKIMKIYFLITFLCVFSMAAENTIHNRNRSVPN